MKQNETQRNETKPKKRFYNPDFFKFRYSPNETCLSVSLLCTIKTESDCHVIQTEILVAIAVHSIDLGGKHFARHSGNLGECRTGFSIVKFIFSPLRSRIKRTFLSDIVFLTVNQVNFSKKKMQIMFFIPSG
jgi:hypothetical protein